MQYLLDANVIIRAQEDYYPIDRIPQFWTWLASMGLSGIVKIPYEIFGEIQKKVMILDRKIDRVLLNRVLAEGYAPDLDDGEIEEIGRDPFLIGYALVDPSQFTVVTKEVSAPSKQRANRKIPDVCRQFGIRAINDFELYRELSFKIG